MVGSLDFLLYCFGDGERSRTIGSNFLKSSLMTSRVISRMPGKRRCRRRGANAGGSRLEALAHTLYKRMTQKQKPDQCMPFVSNFYCFSSVAPEVQREPCPRFGTSLAAAQRADRRQRPNKSVHVDLSPVRRYPLQPRRQFQKSRTVAEKRKPRSARRCYHRRRRGRGELLSGEFTGERT